MTRIQKAPSVSPLLLRLALGAMFLTAGVGKLHTEKYDGPIGAELKELGLGTVVAEKPAAPVIPAENTTPRTEVPPPTTPESKPATDNNDTPGAKPADEPVADKPGASTPPSGGSESANEGGTGADAADTKPTAAEETSTPAVTPEAALVEVEARRVHTIAASLSLAADGNDERARLIPKALGTPGWVKTLAWMAAITEIAAGGLMVIGLFTRLGALGLMGVMGVAMWLTEIGPAAMSRLPNKAFLGFLPPPGPAGDGWQSLLLQFVLFMVAFALLLLGAGRFSLDAWVFGSGDDAPPPRARTKNTSKYDEPAPRPRRPDHPGEISLD